VELARAEVGPVAQVLDELTSSHFVRPINLPGVKEQGLIVVDPDALGLIVDGVLGGAGAPASQGSSRMTPARTTLVLRALNALVSGWSPLAAESYGSAIAIEPAPMVDVGMTGESALLVGFDLRGPSMGGMVTLCLPPLRREERADIPAEDADCSEAAAVLELVELLLVVELGRTRRAVGAMSELSVGQTLLFDDRASSGATVWCGGHRLARAEPVTADDGVVSLKLAQVSWQAA
jgi:flagellar motor switch protein FliM